MTRTKFLEKYKEILQAAYPWARDVDKLAHFLASAEITLSGKGNTWNHDGSCVIAAYHAIGGQGKPSLKALRSLPE